MAELVKSEKTDTQWNFYYTDLVIAVSFKDADSQAEARKIADEGYENFKADQKAAEKARE